MPLLKGKRLCNPDNPCRRGTDKCSRCAAAEHLKEEDWFVVEFYRLVEDQYINQTPGAMKDPLLTPRLEGYESALRLMDYPKESWPFLTKWARELHWLVRSPESRPKSPEQIAHMKSLGVET